MRAALAAVAAAAALVLAADVAVVLTHEDTRAPVRWDARVLPLVSFVEDKRGLRFKHPVPVSFLPDKQFEAKVAPPSDETAKDKEQLAESVGEYRALGLIRGPVDLRAAYRELTSASLDGLYVPDDQAIYVRGTSLSVEVRVILAHELTHVLQDQYFDLTKLQDDAPGGDTTALTALVEGDAVRIQDAYHDQLSKADQKAYDDAGSAAYRVSQQRTTHVPAVLGDFLSFPYVFGPVLLDSLVAAKKVDQAFRTPPTSEAQVVDPVAYPFSTPPADVPVPHVPEGAKAYGDPTPFGQVFLFDVLGSRLGYRDAWAAVQGWRGDRFTGYRVGGVVCSAADILMKDLASAQRLAGAARRWAAPLPGATITLSGTTVALRACDPGTAGGPLPKQDPSAFDVLLVRTQILHELTGSGLGYGEARCVADVVVTDASRDGYRTLTSDHPTEEDIKHVQQVVATAVGHCATG